MAGPGIRVARGLSLVELMVGLALGLFIITTASGLLSGQLRENRSLVRELRLVQDLHNTSELMLRELRRAGHWGAAEEALWQVDKTARSNPYSGLTPASDMADNTGFHYSRDNTENHGIDNNEQFGFRLRQGGIDMLLGSGNWQSLTDTSVMQVTQLQITPSLLDTPLTLACRRPCPAATADSPPCPPRWQVRRLDLQLSAQSSQDPALQRSLAGSVRLRNDLLLGQCPED